MLVTSGTYAYLEMKKNTSVAGSAKCNGINYQGQEINASNLSSTTNYLEGAKSTITLSQSEDCKIYSYVNIYLHVDDNITAPIDSVKALKYKLITEDKVEYNGTITTKGDSLLAVVPLTSDPKNYQVYLWIDSEISSGQFDNKSFSGYIYATSEQSSTIDGGEISNNENVSIETIDFDYVGREQEFIVPASGNYKLETWGAQGGKSRDYAGGVGGYSSGQVTLNRNKVLYVNCGGQGESSVKGEKVAGGYNGGGSGAEPSTEEYYGASGGGGATHIATMSGQLFELENKKNSIFLVSGGGGGKSVCIETSSSGGGIKGNDGMSTGGSYERVPDIISGGTQNSGYSFGKGAPGSGSYANSCSCEGTGGGGGGYYGGNAYQITISQGGNNSSGGGGSGYIGNSLLTNKAMYCYNCEESADESTKTISTTNVSSDAISGYAKKGNGYARVTLIY